MPAQAFGNAGSAAIVNMPQAPVAQAPKGNFLTHLFPTIGGIVGGAGGGAAGGALAGTAVLPGIGTAVGGLLGALLGGAAGGAGGKVLENKQEGQALGNGVAGQALTNGVLSAGPLRLLKVGGDVAKAGIGGGSSLLDALGNGGSAEAKIMTKSALGKTVGAVQNNASDRAAGGMGINVGSSVNGKVLTPEASAALQDFATNGAQKYGGVTAGMPLHQAQDAAAVHSNVISALGSKLDQINRPVTAEDTAGIANAMKSAASANPALAGANLASLSSLAQKVTGATDLKSLEAARMEADKLAYPNGNDLASSQLAQQAGHARDAIDQFVHTVPEGASPEAAQAINDYKAIKGDYGLSKTLVQQASKASNDAKGVHIPFVGADGKAGAQTISGIRNMVNGKIANAGSGAVDPFSLKAIAGRDALGNPAGLLGALSGGLGATSGQATADPTQTTDINGQPIASLTDALTGSQTDPTQQNNSNFSEANIQQAIQKDIATTGGKNISTLMSLYNTFGKPTDTLTTNQKNEVVSQNRAIGSLQAYVNNLTQAGGSEGPLKGAIDGSIAGNYTNPQAKAIDAQRIDVASAIAGSLNPRGTVSPVTARIISEALPSIHDTPKVAQQKIANLMAQIKSGAYSGDTSVSQLIANGTNDPTTATQ